MLISSWKNSGEQAQAQLPAMTQTCWPWKPFSLHAVFDSDHSASAVYLTSKVCSMCLASHRHEIRDCTCRLWGPQLLVTCSQKQLKQTCRTEGSPCSAKLSVCTCFANSRPGAEAQVEGSLSNAVHFAKEPDWGCERHCDHPYMHSSELSAHRCLTILFFISCSGSSVYWECVSHASPSSKPCSPIRVQLTCHLLCQVVPGTISFQPPSEVSIF